MLQGERAGRPTAPPSAVASAAADPLLTTPFTDSFDRTSPGDDWRLTSAVWRIENGRLCGRSARNHGAWLRRRLPVNARIEFDAYSSSTDGDLKAESWGDGASTATGTSYTNATSYLTIFGGWKNRFHVLARIDEHAPDRRQIELTADSPELRARPVKPGVGYHFKIERTDGKTVRWSVDDIELLDYPDPEPLKGPGHEHFGFNDWEVPVCFDNLQVTPHPGA